MNISLNPNYAHLNKTPQASLRKNYSNPNTSNPQKLSFAGVNNKEVLFDVLKTFCNNCDDDSSNLSCL